MHAKILTVSYVTSHCQGGSIKKRNRNFSDATVEDLSWTEYVLFSLLKVHFLFRPGEIPQTDSDALLMLSFPSCCKQDEGSYISLHQFAATIFHHAEAPL